jgi:hypothetical protein
MNSRLCDGSQCRQARGTTLFEISDSPDTTVSHIGQAWLLLSPTFLAPSVMQKAAAVLATCAVTLDAMDIQVLSLVVPQIATGPLVNRTSARDSFRVITSSANRR